MNLLFLTVYNFNSIQESGIYQDLLREFVKKGDHVYVVSPEERHWGSKTHVIEESQCRILKLKTLNQQKCSMVEKGLGILLLERQYIQAIKKYFSEMKFDLVLYSTPPVTFVKVVEFVKKRDHAKTYLLLKDIFPQNAVDLGMLKKTGLKGLLYRYFRAKEMRCRTRSAACLRPIDSMCWIIIRKSVRTRWRSVRIRLKFETCPLVRKNANESATSMVYR